MPPRALGGPHAAQIACPPELAGCRILVVDDERDRREMLRLLLEQCRAVITTAGSAEEAMRLLPSAQYDLLLSDIGMPEKDGFDLIRQVRSLPAHQGGKTPAIALTAYARFEDRTRILLAGFQNHVPKPIEPLELLAVLASVAGRTGSKE